ncbi:MAG: heavy metal translocating P-type ATPase [Ginsengibacter sp.]
MMEEKKKVQNDISVGDSCCNHDHEAHNHQKPESPSIIDGWKKNLSVLIALAILVVMMVLEFGFDFVPAPRINLPIYILAFLLAGYNVLDLAFHRIKRGDIFNEFVLMSTATLGAFYIGAYSEGVAVMVFYTIGEWFQHSAVQKARSDIKALLDIRPDEATVIRNGTHHNVHASKILPGEIILVRSGEKVALDGTLTSPYSSFNAAALTGESMPVLKNESEMVYAGMINLDKVAEIKVTATFKDSALSRILSMVQDAASRKSQTQLFISRFAKVYTPIVFFLAVALTVLPVFFVSDYVFDVWFYRALVFLVISCPCALVISIPLGYFGGIGLASRNGILFKGGNFLDAITKIDTVVMDKTGTLTKGVFNVQRIHSEGISEEELISLTANLERHSIHPVGKAIVNYANGKMIETKAENIHEVPGMGLSGTIDGKYVVAGNGKLFDKFGIDVPEVIKNETDTIVIVAVDKKYKGYFIVADEPKTDALKTVTDLKKMGISTMMLSGDKQSTVTKVADYLGIQQAYGDLLPEDKLEKLQELKNAGHRSVFAGDGINDAPVIALADVGIAMGGLGSDAAIETADVVIQNDQPYKILSAIKIGKITRTIVWQNITLALVVKVAVLALGAGGIATLWEAVIADVGVALLAILNAVRIQRLNV